MAHLPVNQLKKVVAQINLVSKSLLNGQTAFKENATTPYIFNLKYGFDSSLYVVKADETTRMLVAVDEDPVFNKISLTFFQVSKQWRCRKSL